MKPLRLITLLMIFALAATAALADSPDIPPGHERYIVVLKKGAAEPDIQKFGGTLKGKANGVLYISLPPQALEQLRKHDSVEYVQHAILGASAPAPVPNAHGASLGVAAESLKANPAVAPPTWTSGDYVYDGAGNIVQIGTVSSPGNDNKQSVFTYDGASRLTQASIGLAAGDRNESYVYDQYGNMTSKTINGSPVGLGTISQSTNRMDLRNYDEAGNAVGVVGDPTSAYVYDPMNMMIEKDWGAGWSQELYAYTPSDERIGVYTPSTQQWNWTLRDFDGKPIRQYASTSYNWWTWVEDYAWENGRLLGGERQPEEGGRRHFHLDHLGSPRLITGFTGERIGLYDFAPYGEEIGSIQQERNFDNHDREDPMKFTGHERDYLPVMGENNSYLDYMHARYYAATFGRFMSVDPVTGNPHRPQTWNRYTYVLDNPVGATDPNGLDCTSVTVSGLGTKTVCDPFDAAGWAEFFSHGYQFISGASNAFASDQLLGIGRVDSANPYYQLGEIAGDFGGMAQGFNEMYLGFNGEIGGFLADLAPGGQLVGVPANLISAGVIAHGGATTAISSWHMMSGVKGLQEQVRLHEQKLADYKANPDAHDNKGFLKNASPEQREKIIAARIRSLEGQIQNFKRQIQNLLNK